LTAVDRRIVFIVVPMLWMFKREFDPFEGSLFEFYPHVFEGAGLRGAVFWAYYGLAGWLSVLAALGWAIAPLWRPAAHLLEASRLALTFYVLHLPIVRVAMVLVGSLTLPAPVALSNLFVAGLIATVATCVGLDRLLALFRTGAAAVGHMLSRA
jgi:hypothetical protein